MTLYELITHMMDFAAKTKDDNLSCFISRTAGKLEYHGTLFDHSFTKQERKIINYFMKEFS
jgi:hypothetical protein